MTNNAINEKTLELSLKINTTAYDWLKDIAKIKPQFVPETVEPFDEIVTETRSLNPIKEEKSMESADRIEITFKSGETISYGKGEWDDYAYDGKAVIVKKNSEWIGIYNFDDVFCVELK